MISFPSFTPKPNIPFRISVYPRHIFVLYNHKLYMINKDWDLDNYASGYYSIFTGGINRLCATVHNIYGLSLNLRIKFTHYNRFTIRRSDVYNSLQPFIRKHKNFKLDLNA